MDLETMLKDIQSRGDKAVEEIRSESQKEAEQLLRDAQVKKKALIEGSLADARRTAERLRIQEISRVELENSRAALIMQKDMLDMALDKAREKLFTLPADKDRDLLRRLLTKNGSLAPVVISSKKQEATVKSLAPSLKYGGSIEGLGGIILQTVDGSIRYDFRYETLLEQAAQSSMKAVADLLFRP